MLDAARIGRLLVERQDAYRTARVLAKYQRRLAKAPSSAAATDAATSLSGASAAVSTSASARVGAWLAGQQSSNASGGGGGPSISVTDPVDAINAVATDDTTVVPMSPLRSGSKPSRSHTAAAFVRPRRGSSQGDDDTAAQLSAIKAAAESRARAHGSAAAVAAAVAAPVARLSSHGGGGGGSSVDGASGGSGGGGGASGTGLSLSSRSASPARSGTSSTASRSSSLTGSTAAPLAAPADTASASGASVVTPTRALLAAAPSRISLGARAQRTHRAAPSSASHTDRDRGARDRERGIDRGNQRNHSTGGGGDEEEDDDVALGVPPVDVVLPPGMRLRVRELVVGRGDGDAGEWHTVYSQDVRIVPWARVYAVDATSAANESTALRSANGLDQQCRVM